MTEFDLAQRLLERLGSTRGVHDEWHLKRCLNGGNFAQGQVPCACTDLRAFLAQPEPAAREVALELELTKHRDHWRAALAAWKGNETIDIDYATALRMESDLTHFLADTSPAAAALLAQGEEK